MKKLFNKIKKEKGVNFQSMSLKIGKEKKFLSVRLTKDSLKVADLKKCLECVGEKLVIVFDGKNYEI